MAVPVPSDEERVYADIARVLISAAEDMPC
jgi:hypothetical protein